MLFIYLYPMMLKWEMNKQLCSLEHRHVDFQIKVGSLRQLLSCFFLGQSLQKSTLKVFYALQMKKCELVLLMLFYKPIQLAYNIHSFKLFIFICLMFLVES